MTCIHKNPSLIPSAIICNQTSLVGTYVLHVSRREGINGVYSYYYTYLVRQGESDQTCKWNKKLIFKDPLLQAHLMSLKIKYKSSRIKHNGIKKNFYRGEAFTKHDTDSLCHGSLCYGSHKWKAAKMDYMKI